VADPRIDESHDGIAIAAHNPELARQLAQLSRFLALDLPWCERQDLRELAIQVVNRELHCEYSFRTRAPIAAAAGVGLDAQHALSEWRSSALFNEEQRLVIEYAQAVIRSEVSDELFLRVAQAYTEKGAIEFTTVVAFWSFWAMVLNATRAD
jgi:alkylhydroperoxidase family enzyme